MTERKPFVLRPTIKELNDAILGKEYQRPIMEDIGFVAKETAQTYKEVIKVAGVAVAAMALKLLIDKNATLHSSTVDLLS